MRCYCNSFYSNIKFWIRPDFAQFVIVSHMMMKVFRSRSSKVILISEPYTGSLQRNCGNR